MGRATKVATPRPPQKHPQQRTSSVAMAASSTPDRWRPRLYTWVRPSPDHFLATVAVIRKRPSAGGRDVPIAAASTCSNQSASPLGSGRTTGMALYCHDGCVEGSRFQFQSVENRDRAVSPPKMPSSASSSPRQSACTCNQSLWVGNDVSPPAAGAPIGGFDFGFAIVAQGLAYRA
jgi:hypothetical protein